MQQGILPAIQNDLRTRSKIWTFENAVPVGTATAALHRKPKRKSDSRSCVAPARRLFALVFEDQARIAREQLTLRYAAVNEFRRAKPRRRDCARVVESKTTVRQLGHEFA